MGRKRSKKSEIRIDLVLRYQAGDEEAGEELVKDMQPVVEALAFNLKSHFNGHVDYDDILSDCYLGLLDAFNKYDVGKGTKFENYARTRMRGTVYDGVRQRNPGVRQITRLEKKLDKLRNDCPDFEFQSYEERRELTGMSKLAFYGAISASNLQNTCSLYEIVDSSEDLRFCDVLENKKERSLENLMLANYIETFMQMIEDPWDKEIFRLYFLEELQMRKVGEIVDLSESRVSQVIQGIGEIRENAQQLLEKIMQELESKTPEEGKIVRSYLLSHKAA